MLLLLPLLMLGTISLEPVSTLASGSKLTMYLTREGDYIALLGGQMFHWDADGKLKLEVQLPHSLLSVLYDRDLYWLSANREVDGPGSKKIFSSYSIFLNKNGEKISECTEGARYSQWVGDHIFAPLDVFDSWDRSAWRDSPFLAKEILLKRTRNSVEINSGKVRFMRLPKIIFNHHFDFKQIWIETDPPMTKEPSEYLKSEGTFLVVHQLAPIVYQFNQKSISLQNFDENALVPNTQLRLPGYVPPPQEAFSPVRPMLQEEFEKRFVQELRSWSRIHWFGRTTTGFAICYSLANLEGGPTSIRVALLDGQFKTLKFVDLDAGQTFLGISGSELLVYSNTMVNKALRIKVETLTY